MFEPERNPHRWDLEHEYANTVEPLKYQFLFMMTNIVGMLKLSPFEKSAEVVSNLMGQYTDALTKDYYEYRELWITAACKERSDV